jgi:hypothetical protein
MQLQFGSILLQHNFVLQHDEKLNKIASIVVALNGADAQAL